jgi:HD-GYP domain-containing protein (c-di-GMP phosphodiesterase class II)
MNSPAARVNASTVDEHEVLLLELGPQLLLRLLAVVRTARTHDVSNQAFHHQLHELLALLQRMLDSEEGEVALASVNDYFYINGVRIRAQASMMSVHHSMIGELERRSIAGLRFIPGVNAAELERFFQLFMAAEDPALAERFGETLQEASVSNIIPIARSEADQTEIEHQLEMEPASERGRAKRVFWRAVVGTKKVLMHATQTGRPDMRHAKRLVQPVVDSILNHEYSIVGLTALKEHDEYTYAHCVNVAILSVSMGKVLGFPRQGLADLGVSALLHDIGKIAVPGEVLRKPAKLDDHEWELMRRHPLEGMKMLVRMPGLSMLSLDAMRGCLEHHMNFDGTGYPTMPSWNQGTIGRVIALGDCFDAMTAHRAYAKRPFTPFEALSPNPDDLLRPHCRVLVRPDGHVEPEEGGETWSPMPPDEQVMGVVTPEDFKMDTSGYLAA